MKNLTNTNSVIITKTSLPACILHVDYVATALPDNQLMDDFS